MKFKNKRKASFFIFIILTSLLLYAFADLQASKAGVKEATRSSVYAYLFITVILFTLYNLFQNKTIFLHKNIRPLWLILFWIVIVGYGNSNETWSIAIQAGLSFWWIMSYAFFYNYERKHENNKFIIFFFLVMFSFYIYATIFAFIRARMLYDRDFAVLNSVYYIVVLTPFIFFIKNYLLRITLLAISVFLVVFSFKRGAIIIFPLMFLSRTFSNAKLSNKKLNYYFNFIVVISLFIIALTIFNNLSDNLLFSRFSQEELETGSGRMDIYKLIINDLGSRNLLMLFFGTGAGSSIQLVGTSAHNEWLEFFYSYGGIGILLYIAITVSLIQRYRSLMKEKNIYAPTYSMLITYFLIIGLFGGFYFSHSTFYFFAQLGYIEAKVYNGKKSQLYEV